MTQHIGIVGVSPEGTALCYRQIFRHAHALLGERPYPTVTIHNEPFQDYIAAALRDDWNAVGRLLNKSATILANAGAEFCIVPDNLIQHGLHIAESDSPIPYLKMTDLVAAQLAHDNCEIVGLIGTKLVMSGTTYQVPLGLKGVKLLVPKENDADTVDTIIFRELIFGNVTLNSQSSMKHVLNTLAQRGCAGVILGSSEIPLIVNEESTTMKIYDATNILAEGAVRMALGEDPLAV